LASRWTKKDKSDFYRTIVSFGVARRHASTHGNGGSVPGTNANGYNRSRLASGSTNRRQPPLARNAHSTLEHDWTRFKELSGLSKKPDEVMEEYYHHFVKLCQQVVDKNNNSLQNRQSRESSLSSTHPKIDTSTAGDDDDDKDDKDDKEDGAGDALPLDRAKRVLKRVELMNVIRDEILTNPRVDELLGAGRRSPGLPSWWLAGVHDKPFLEGLAKHGINRQDLIVTDETLPFAAISQHYAALQKELREKKSIAAANGEKIDDAVKQDEDGGEDPVEKAVKAAALADQIDRPSSLDSAGGKDLIGPSLLGRVEGIVGEHLSTVKMEEEIKIALVSKTVMDDVSLSFIQDTKDILSTGGATLDKALDKPAQTLLGMNSVETGEATTTPDVDKSLLSESTIVKSESPSVASGQTSSGSVIKDRKPTPQQETEEFVWPKEAVVLRRVDHLIDIVMNPKPVVGKKRKLTAVSIPSINNGVGSPAAGSDKRAPLDRDFGSDAGDRSDHGEETASAYSIPPSPNKKPAVVKKKLAKKPKEQVQPEKEKEKEKGKKAKAPEPVLVKGKKDKKRKGQNEEEDQAENEPVTPKKRVKTKASPPALTTSASLVTISSETNGTGPDGSSSKQSGLKLLIKLKMPSLAPPVQVTTPSVVKAKGKKREAKSKPKVKPVKERPSAAAKPSSDDKTQPTKKPVSERKKKDVESSGSDTDEMMAIASKQLEYLQRKIQEKKKMKRTSSPQLSIRVGSKSSKAKAPPVGGSIQGNASVAKPLTARYSRSPPPSHLNSEPRRSESAQKPSADRQRGRSRSRSSRSSSSSRSRSSRSSSSSGSSSSSSSRSSPSSRSRSSSGSSSSSGSDSDSRRRRRKRGQHKSGLQRRSSGGSIRRRTRSVSRSRSRSFSRSRSRSLSRSRSRSLSHTRSRSRSLSRSRSRSRSRSMSPPRPYSDHERYRNPHPDTMTAPSSSSVDQQHQLPYAHGAHPNGVGSSYEYDHTAFADQHQQQQQPLSVSGKSNGKKRDNDGNGGSKRREGFMDDDRFEDDGYYHKNSRA
ncbi:hypothetical protein BGZ91_002912, partial [Linnemannia elongata]